MALYNNSGPNNPLSLDTQGKPKFQEGLGNKPPRTKKQKGGYTVQGGDNYFTLAKQIYGSERFAGLLIEANGGRSLRPGDVINVPKTDQSATEVNFSPWAMEQARNLTANTAYGQRQQQAQTQTTQPTTQVTLTNPGTGAVNTQTATPYTPPATGVAMPPGYLNYSAMAAQPVSAPRGPRPRPPRANPYANPNPNYQGASLYTPPPQQSGPANPQFGLNVNTYTRLYGSQYTPDYGNFDINITNRDFEKVGRPVIPETQTRPYSPNAAGTTNPSTTGNSQQNVTQKDARGMTGSQTALALESGIANKPAGTYQVTRTYQRPIYSSTEVDVWGQPKIIGWETTPYTVGNSNNPVINVGVMGTKPAAYVGFTGDVLNGGKPGQGRIIGGGEGYADYTPAGIPRPPGSPVYGNGGGGYGSNGGGGRGGGGGGGPSGGGGRGAFSRYSPPPVYAQAGSTPGYSRPGREAFGLSREGLSTWKL